MVMRLSADAVTGAWARTASCSGSCTTRTPRLQEPSVSASPMRAPFSPDGLPPLTSVA